MDTIARIPCQELPDGERRENRVFVRFNDAEYHALKMTARKYDLSLSETIRRLIQEEDERNHYHLIESEDVRRKRREAS